MFVDLRKRAQKVGQPPGTPVYTGGKDGIGTRITTITYSLQTFHEVTGTTLKEILPPKKRRENTWIHEKRLEKYLPVC